MYWTANADPAASMKNPAMTTVKVVRSGHAAQLSFALLMAIDIQSEVQR